MQKVQELKKADKDRILSKLCRIEINLKIKDTFSKNKFFLLAMLINRTADARVEKTLTGERWRHVVIIQ